MCVDSSPKGRLKCNVNASFHTSCILTSVGRVLCNEDGTLVSTRACWTNPIVQVYEGETATLLTTICNEFGV